jgi:ligand-binding sensor domain-containing protein
LHRFILICLIVLSGSKHLAAQPPLQPIGQWRDHLNFSDTRQIVKGDQLYIATATHIFALDTDREITSYSKSTGLNDLGVAAIGWDNNSTQLLIAYNNSNLDVLTPKGNIKNIGDIQRSNFPGNKTIRSIYCDNGLAYLSTGLGIIVVNLIKYEIKDTWIIGRTGNQTNVNAFTRLNNFFFAASEEGLLQIASNAPNPSNFSSWQLISGSNGLSSGSVKQVLSVNNQLVVWKNDSLLIQTGSNWQLLYRDVNWPITHISSSENRLLIGQRTNSGNARVIQLNTNGQIEKITAVPGVISLPRSALLEGNQLWIADQFGGLSFHSSTVERFIPNGPPGIATGAVAASAQQLVMAAGSVNETWNYLFNRNGVYFFNGEWTSKSFFNTPILDSVLDFIAVAIDPTDQSVWAGSYGGGLVHFRNSSSPVIYKQGNSSLQAAAGDPGSYRVGGLAFDSKNRLWVSNYGAASNLHVRKPDGKWLPYSVPFALNELAAGHLLCDDTDQIWLVSPKNNGLICYSPGDPDVLNDDRWKKYETGLGKGNLPSNNVLSVAKDRTGNIWVGTDQGIGIIRCPTEVFTVSGCDAYRPVVRQGSFAGFLLKDQSVQCIAVDGFNRKWVGTKNGLWLLSESGEEVIQYFNLLNSPLLSNNVLQIGIQPQTGEVFILTDRGICSYRGTATESRQEGEKVLVFPNPVPPDYNGIIAIRGLKENSLVKITELNGNLVFQTRSQGGQATWDGKNYKGQKPASGVYMVWVRDDENNFREAARIILVSGR